MSAGNRAQLRRACEELERAVRRAARSVIAPLDVDEELEKFPGGVKMPPAAELSEGDWWSRRLRLHGLLRFLHALQLAERTGEASDYLRLRTYAQEPERVELTCGAVIACYPVTLPVAERMSCRMAILGLATAAGQALEDLPPEKGKVTMRLRFDRERLWQRQALMYEATLPPGSVAHLPVDPPLLTRLVLQLLAWSEGLNRWGVELWRTRWIVGQAWRWVDKVTGAHRLLGLPPWWTWLASPLDYMGVIRAHLLANDERVRGLPALPSSGKADGWGWSGFAAGLAAARHKLVSEFVRDVSLVSMLQDAADAQFRERRRQQEQERRAREAKQHGRRGR